MALFADRADAGHALVAELAGYRGQDAVVFGIPRGGVVVAAVVAEELGLRLDAVVVRKLGAPGRAEFAVGAIADGVRFVDAAAVRATGTSSEQLAAVEQAERRELARRGGLFAAAVPDLTDRTAIVVDDGVATGATAIAACRSLRYLEPDRIVLAVPVAPSGWRPDPEAVDDYVCPHRMADFWAVGLFYDDFAQTTDADVVSLLAPAD